VAGHNISVGRLQQCGDRWSDLLTWLAQVVVVLFLKLVCSGSLICGFGGLAVLQVWRSGNLRVRGWQCCGATGLGSGFPEIDEWQRQSGSEGSSDNDYWVDRWVSRSSRLDWSLGSVNVDGWVWR
jgi:hypothetical protein